jgi:hypothetical protein
VAGLSNEVRHASPVNAPRTSRTTAWSTPRCASRPSSTPPRG